MSPWDGPAYTGAMRDWRAGKRAAAQRRNARTLPARRSLKAAAAPAPADAPCPVRPDKDIYTSRQAAAAVLARLPKIRRRQGLHPYPCPGGSHYHLGRWFSRLAVAYRSSP